MKIATIIGARPQFIKAATISRAIAEHNRNNSSPVIVVADQLSHLLLCPSQVAVNNLAVEGIGKDEGLLPGGKVGATPSYRLRGHAERGILAEGSLYHPAR